MGKIMVGLRRILPLCAVVLLLPAVESYAQANTSQQAVTFLTQMITLAMQNGGEGQEAQLEALKQQIEALPKPKRGDRKAARLQHDKGLEEFKKERYAQALQFFLTAYRLDAGDVEVVNNVGMAYLKTGNLKEAARYLGGALRLAPHRAAAWGNLAEVFARDARLKEAVAAYALTYRYSKNKDATRRLLEAQTTNVDHPQVMQAAKAALALPLISGRTASGEDQSRGLAEKKLGGPKEQPASAPPVASPVPRPTPPQKQQPTITASQPTPGMSGDPAAGEASCAVFEPPPVHNYERDRQQYGNITATWSGSCEKGVAQGTGFAQGTGTLTWHNEGLPFFTEEFTGTNGLVMSGGSASMSDLVNERAVVWKVDECPSQGVCQGDTRTARGAVSTDFNLGFRWISDHFLGFGLEFVDTNYPSQNPGTIRIILYQGVPTEKIDKFTEAAVLWGSDEFGILDLPPTGSCIVEGRYENKPCWRRLDAGEKAWQAAAKQRAQEAQSKVMTEAELRKFIEEQVKAYGAVMTPDNEIENKKLFRTPEAYEGKVVALGGKFWSHYGDLSLFEGVQGRFLARGVVPKSKVLTFNDAVFLIGVLELVKRGAREQGHWGAGPWVINTYLICGLLTDDTAKKAEVLCETLKRLSDTPGQQKAETILSRQEKGPTPTPPVPMGHEGIDSALHECAIINDRDYSQHITLGATPWIHLNRGQENGGYQLSRDGSLFYQGQMLAHNVPVSGASGREGDQWIYAQSVLLSPKSPSGRFAILQACEEQDLKGQCWALFVVDHGSRRIERTHAGKYGPTKHWVAWVRGEDEYAVLRYMSEGMTTLYRIHLPTSESRECGAKPVQTPPTSTTVSREPKGTGKNLIVLVHGCCTDNEKDLKEWDDLGEAILEKIGKKEEWEVVVWDWTPDTPKRDYLNLLNPGVNWFIIDAQKAYDAAYDHDGKKGQSGILAAAINRYSTYKYIHFIGHSAGAKLIHEAANTLAKDKKRAGGERPFIHLTFLDAYTRTKEDSGEKGGKGYGDLDNYPKEKHFVEHYVDRSLASTAFSTDACLASAFNFNISNWSHSPGEGELGGHQWPRRWYEKSVTSTSPKFKYGFSLSLEGGGKDINELSKYSAGQQCPLTTITIFNENPDCQQADCWK